MKTKTKAFVIGTSSVVLLFLLFGIITDLIPNLWFIRMTEKTALDYFFLVLNSLFLGIIIALYYYKKNMPKACAVGTYSGGIGGFLAFACPICNKLLVFLFGATALMAYLDPFRPILGFLSIGVLGFSMYILLQNIGLNKINRKVSKS